MPYSTKGLDQQRYLRPRSSIATDTRVKSFSSRLTCSSYLCLRIRKLRENCDKEFEAHWKCLDQNNQELRFCRSEEYPFNKCMLDKLVSVIFDIIIFQEELAFTVMI